MRLKWLIRLLFFLCGLSYLNIFQIKNIVEAEESIPSPLKEEPPALSGYVRFETLESWKENDTYVVALRGNPAEVYLPDYLIRADVIIGWTKEVLDKKRPVPFEEIYAEGNPEVIMDKDIIRAKRVYYDIKNSKGILTEVELRTIYQDELGNVPPEAVPVVLRAAEVYQINSTTYIAKNASVTTCPHGKPHYDFYVVKVKFIRDEKGKRLILTHIIPRIVGIPFFYFPYFYRTVGSEPVIHYLRAEESRRFGYIVRAKYGILLNRYKRDQTGNLIRDKKGYYISQNWGRLTIQNDYYQKRGLGWRPELTYDSDSYQGFIKTYYIKDKGPDESISYEQQFLPLEKENRGRVRIFHRHQFTPNLRFDCEGSWLSDRNFLMEFFESEAKEQKEPETYGYLRLLNPQTSFTLLERIRINDFQTQTEYLPQFKTYLIKNSFPWLGAKKYFSNITELSNINRRYDKKLNLRGVQLWRFDSLNEFSFPFSLLGFINFSSFFAFRVTAYEKSLLEDEPINRIITSGGVRFFSQFFRIFDTTNFRLGIDKLRHLISFDLRFSTNNVSGIKPSELIQNDTIDELEDFQEYFLEIRNRFQTKSGEKIRDFLNIGLSVEYYPHARRDTTQLVTSNYLYPMSWISLAPNSQNYYEKRYFSNLNLDLQFTPREIFYFSLNCEYNPYKNKNEVFDTILKVSPFSGWDFSFTTHYIEKFSNALGLGITCRPLEKWQLSFFDQYDFYTQRLINRTFILRRDLHELFLEFTVFVDKGKDEIIFNLNLSPKGLFKLR